MTTQVRLPKLGFSMTEAAIREWLAPDGASVTEGQPLYSLEAEKAVEEVPAPASGRLKILVLPSDRALQVGTLLAEIT